MLLWYLALSPQHLLAQRLHLAHTPEEASSIVEDLCLRGILLDEGGPTCP